MKVGVFDSGIGGLTTLDEMQKMMPEVEFIYYADSEHNPYGNKSDDELMQIARKIVNDFVAQNISLIVVACNTATTKCIGKLREEYPNVTFVGTEPAIKLACDSEYNNILVMATPGTIASERTHALVAENQHPEQKITLLPCDGLAEAVESKDRKRSEDKLNELLKNYIGLDYDAIVIGCTHYIYLRDKIQKLFPKAKLIDGNKGVARRVKELIK